MGARNCTSGQGRGAPACGGLYRARGERAKAQEAQRASPVRVAPRARERTGGCVRRKRQVSLGAADPQALRSRFQLECPKCKGPMRIIALIDDPPVVQRILEHLGLWQPEASERSPPVPPGAWPVSNFLPMTYDSPFRLKFLLH